MDIKELSGALRTAGVVGAGGAGFPTYAKLNDKADTIIMNCAECEPLLKLHRQLLQEHAPEIIKAFEEVAIAVGASNAIIAIKEEYKGTVEACQYYINEHSNGSVNLSIHTLPSVYPMGDEVVLIYECTKRVVRPGGLPIEQGVAVFNVETLYNAYRALVEKEGVYSKCVSVVGEVEHPVTVRVPIGMKIKDVIACAGKITCADPVYLIGGPMMGGFKSDLAPVTKTVNAIIVLPRTHPLVYKKTSKFSVSVARAASSCCQCQTCTDLCPRHALGHPIQPHMFMRSAANNDTTKIEPFVNTYFCCSCGVCELYSCPQGLNPRSMMAEYKAGLRKAGVKPPQVEAASVDDFRELRRVPEHRLEMRLGLSQYNVAAPLDNSIVDTNYVEILLSQHIGAPAIPTVTVGQQVKVNDLIAQAADGLSVNIHASISGTVKEVTDKAIIIVK